MLKGKTKTGFVFEIDEKRLDNMELLDAIAEMENDNIIALSNVSQLLLGKEQRKALYDHIRDEDGTVPSKFFSDELVNIFESVKEIKNS